MHAQVAGPLLAHRYASHATDSGSHGSAMQSCETYSAAGCGGHRLSDIEDDQKAWIAEAASHHGFGRVTVESGTSLLWEYVRNKDGRVHDSARIRNDQLERRRCNVAATGLSSAHDGTAGAAQGTAALQQGMAGTLQSADVQQQAAAAEPAPEVPRSVLPGSWQPAEAGASVDIASA